MSYVVRFCLEPRKSSDTVRCLRPGSSSTCPLVAALNALRTARFLVTRLAASGPDVRQHVHVFRAISVVFVTARF